MSVSFPTGKLFEIQQLVVSWLHMQTSVVSQVMSLLGKANFCANGHAQLHCLCHVIQNDMFIGLS